MYNTSPFKVADKVVYEFFHAPVMPATQAIESGVTKKLRLSVKELFTRFVALYY
jgi:hypothetical protein